MKEVFSKWPGARERQLFRRHSHPHFFPGSDTVTEQDIHWAQLQDQQELAQFQLGLETLIAQCMELNEQSDVATITAVKKDLDQCQDTAFGLGADLTEQTNAISLLNEVITTAMRRAMQDSDDGQRLRLIQNEGNRLAKLNQLAYPVVCDILRTDSPIPEEELGGALLCEKEPAYKVALEVLSEDRKLDLAKRLDTIQSSLTSDDHIQQATRKLEILTKLLPVTTEEAVPG